MDLLFDDDDFEIIEFLQHHRHLCTVRRIVNHMMERYDFRVGFRLSKRVVCQLLGYIANEISSRTDK